MGPRMLPCGTPEDTGRRIDGHHLPSRNKVFFKPSPECAGNTQIMEFERSSSCGTPLIKCFFGNQDIYRVMLESSL